TTSNFTQLRNGAIRVLIYSTQICDHGSLRTSTTFSSISPCVALSPSTRRRYSTSVETSLLCFGRRRIAALWRLRSETVMSLGVLVTFSRIHRSTEFAAQVILWMSHLPFTCVRRHPEWDRRAEGERLLHQLPRPRNAV